jgi:hypothetical protein
MLREKVSDLCNHALQFFLLEKALTLASKSDTCREMFLGVLIKIRSRKKINGVLVLLFLK